jgi:ureidoacrylate peracid hydrolase
MNERIELRQAALLVVDVQNDFCSLEGDGARRASKLQDVQRMVPRLVQFIEQARRARLPVIYIQSIHDEWTASPMWAVRRSDGELSKNCLPGTWGAEFYEGINPLPTEKIVVKHRYSAFINTELNTVLRSKGIQSVLVTGVTTNVCVEAAARDAFAYDYGVIVVEDCVAAYDERWHRNSLENIARHFGLVLPASKILESLDQGQSEKRPAGY